MPLRFRDGIALARVSVNQKPMTFLVDSAGLSMVNSDHVSLPVVRQIRTGIVTATGTDPLSTWNVVAVKSLVVGSTELRDWTLLAHSLRTLEAKLLQEVDGILGNDVLRLWDSVSLDYKHSRLVLEHSGCPERDGSDSAWQLQHLPRPVGHGSCDVVLAPGQLRRPGQALWKTAPSVLFSCTQLDSVPHQIECRARVRS